MPLEYEIDSKRKLVIAKVKGALTKEHLFAYQNEVWTRPEVRGFDELVDMREAGQIDQPDKSMLQQLAKTASSMDDQDTKTRFAIVPDRDLAFGLGRMYQAYRDLAPQSNKEVAVFRIMEEALAWLSRDKD